MGNVLYGMDTTRSVDDQIMVNHATAVKKGADKSLVFFASGLFGIYGYPNKG